MLDQVARAAATLGFAPGAALQTRLSELGEDLDDLVPLPTFDRLLGEASVQLEDPCLSFRLGLGTSLPDLRSVGYMMLHSPTVGVAMEQAKRYIRVTQTDTELRTRSEGGLLHVSYHVSDPACAHCYEDGEYTAGLFVAALSALAQVDVTPVEIRFRRPLPQSDVHYRELLPGVRLRFGEPESAVLVDESIADYPVANADPYLRSILEQHAQVLLRQAGTAGNDELESQVEQAFADALTTGQPRIVDIARTLGLGERTLQRRLGERGLTFREVAERVRERLARDHVARPDLSFSEIAFLLGYSEARAFGRAFRRWTGQNPREFRRRARATPAATA